MNAVWVSGLGVIRCARLLEFVSSAVSPRECLLHILLIAQLKIPVIHGFTKRALKGGSLIAG
jgi:hypothetical protein